MITQHATIRNGSIIRREPAKTPVPQHKRGVILDVHDDGMPSFNSDTHKCSRAEQIIHGDRVQVIYTVAPKPLDDVQAWAIQTIDESAETARQNIISAAPGMVMTYIEKHAQARAVIALGEDVAALMPPAEQIAQFPTLAASIGVDAPDLWGVAQVVIAKYEAWADVSYQIERTRMTAKAAVRAAADVAAIAAVVAGLSWPA